ncbi:hypothetical protein [Streptomyces albipurpureus]|uniref:Uncharacterized protein n=1 Tax=Streptomyces albipurpureus TaxID=2897419 RepID=A0ABT0V030_9ACTN|nr:hypothetical protein [Streptomyces sp. CWNU-1]MCM2394159.1 hypothetical protein [Streptomyces sp. CWNU-1]
MGGQLSLVVPPFPPDRNAAPAPRVPAPGAPARGTAGTSLPDQPAPIPDAARPDGLPTARARALVSGRGPQDRHHPQRRSHGRPQRQSRDLAVTAFADPAARLLDRIRRTGLRALLP